MPDSFAISPRESHVATRAFIVANIMAVVTLVAFVATSFRFDIPFGRFSNDPTGDAHGYWYRSLLSNLGVAVWFASCVAAGFTSTISLCGRSRRVFFGSLALLSAVMGLDDAFSVHEQFRPDTFSVGENALPILYGLIVVVMAVTHIRVVRSTFWLPLMVAAVSFGISRSVRIVPVDLASSVAAVASFKFVGIVNWGTYCSLEWWRSRGRPPHVARSVPSSR